MGWATFQAIFSQTHPVTLLAMTALKRFEPTEASKEKLDAKDAWRRVLVVSSPGLPDVIFSNQKYQFG
jgi:hypothetical protein